MTFKVFILPQRKKGWGAAVIPQLARDNRYELPEVKEFSERNIEYIIRFAREYGASPILQPPVGKIQPVIKVPQPVAEIGLQGNIQQLILT